MNKFKMALITLALFTLTFAKAQNLTTSSDVVFAANHVQVPSINNKEDPNPKPFSVIGKWRGVFQIRPDLEVPFNFEIRTTDKNGLEAYFINGEEQFDGGRVIQKADSLFIFLDQFDNELNFKISNNALSGTLGKQDKSGNLIMVKAEKGKDFRFYDNNVAPTADISGTYDITFISENGKEEKAVGLFKQVGNKLSGTFLRITGDSRYLEGVVQGSQFYLSSFIGSAPGYYTGHFSNDGHLSGEIIGSRGSQKFEGVHNEEAVLPDAYSLTFLKDGYHSLDISFPDMNGDKISLSDKKFKDKVVILAIGGTWCPNCVDEASFLAPWYKANKSRGIEVLSIFYERKTDPDFVKKVFTRFKKKYDIQYDIVIGGLADKQQVASSLPALNNFIAFPTTIFIDKKGQVAKIHTGYSGPATGKYFTDFVKEFNDEIDLLLK